MMMSFEKPKKSASRSFACRPSINIIIIINSNNTTIIITTIIIIIIIIIIITTDYHYQIIIITTTTIIIIIKKCVVRCALVCYCLLCCFLIDTGVWGRLFAFRKVGLLERVDRHHHYLHHHQHQNQRHHHHHHLHHRHHHHHHHRHQGLVASLGVPTDRLISLISEYLIFQSKRLLESSVPLLHPLPPATILSTLHSSFT